ncbi:MAG: hypothetical protein WC261_06725 [Synergistaceae bacterium]|jgi:hypothetical protein
MANYGDYVYDGDGNLLPSNYYGKGLFGDTSITPVTAIDSSGSVDSGGAGYAGYDYDVDQWNKRMDAQSAAEAALRLQKQYSGGSRSSATSSYSSPAQYASRQMALQINSLPQLSLTAPQYEQWDNRARQAEVQKVANPMVREVNDTTNDIIARLNALNPTERKYGIKQALQAKSGGVSKAFGTANQIGSQQYANILNYKNQQTAQDADIANRMAAADYAKKMSAIGYNAGLGQEANNQQKYRYTDYV